MHEIKPTGIYSADEIAEIFETTKRYVWSVLSSGDLTGRKVSKRWYSTGAALLAFLENPPPPASAIELQSEREAALSKAWQDAGGSVQNTVKLMNQRMQNGGPAPEQAGKWTQSSVQKIAQHLGLQQK